MTLEERYIRAAVLAKLQGRSDYVINSKLRMFKDVMAAEHRATQRVSDWERDLEDPDCRWRKK